MTLLIEHRPAGLPVPWQRMPVDGGQTVEQIVMECYGSLDGIEAWVQSDSATLQWELIPRDMWRYVRPRRDACMRFTFRPAGGRSGNIFAVVATLALALAAPWLGGLAAGALGFAGSATFANVISAGIVLGGGLLISALFPSAAVRAGAIAGAERRESNTYKEVSTDGNVLAKGAFLPIVVGRRRLTPPDIIQPRARLEEGIQTIDRCVALWGHHDITNVWIDGAPAGSISEITTEIVSGDGVESVNISIDKISASSGLGEELSQFVTSDTALDDQDEPANSEPRWHPFASSYHDEIEEVSLRLRIDSLVTTDSLTQRSAIPLRIRMRPKGSSTWINLPELHLSGRSTSTLIRDIRFRWDEEFGPGSTDNDIQWRFFRVASSYHETPSQPDNWACNSWFSNGSDYISVKNISAQRFGIRVLLDPATMPRDEYEFQIITGARYNEGALNDTYQIGGVRYSLFRSYFSASNEWSTPVSQGGFLARVSTIQVTSIADEWPTYWPRTAMVGLTSRGVSLRAITVEAARYVHIYSGGNWNTLTDNSDNPAAHYRELLLDLCEGYGINTDRIDDAQLAAWYTQCATRGYRCSAVFAGETFAEALQAVAAAGFAKPRFSDKFGIDYFRDRSSDVPVQFFSPRNASAVKFQMAMPERPFGFRVQFSDREQEWRDSEIEVAIDAAQDIANWEVVRFPAIDDESLARERAYFDLLQRTERRRQWTVETALEGVVCEVGDLVSLASDLMSDLSFGARVTGTTSGNFLDLDQIVPDYGFIPGSDEMVFEDDEVVLFEDSDPMMFELPQTAPGPDSADTIEELLVTGGDYLEAWLRFGSGIAVRRITGVNGRRIFISPDLGGDYSGYTVQIVRHSDTMHRCIVTNIERLDEERARLTLVDEAPQIWQIMNELFG